MKKLSVIGTLWLLGFWVIQLHGMEESTPMQAEATDQTNLTYTIECEEGRQTITIGSVQFEKLKKYSKTVAHLIQDIASSENNLIPLHELTQGVVNNILTILGKITEPNITEFINTTFSLDDLIALLQAANYLDISDNMNLSLIDLLAQVIAQKISQQIHDIPAETVFQKIKKWLTSDKKKLLQKLPTELSCKISAQLALAQQLPLFIPLTIHSSHDDHPIWNPHNKHQFITTSSNEIKVWTYIPLTNQLNSLLLTGHTKTVTCFAWNPHDQHQFISGSNDGTLLLWDFSNNQWQSQQLTDHTSSIICITWNPHNKNQFISVSNDGTLLLWNKSSNNQWQSQKLTDGMPTISFLTWNPHNKHQFISVSHNNAIRIWDYIPSTNQWDSLTSRGPHLSSLPSFWGPLGPLSPSASMPTPSINYIAWDPHHDNQFISVSDDGTLLLWNKSSDNQWQSQKLIDNMPTIRFLTWNPHNKNQFISVSNDGTLLFWDKSSDNQWQSQKLADRTGAIKCISWNPHNEYQFISVSNNGTLLLWNKSSNNQWQSHLLDKSSNSQWQSSFFDDDTREITHVAWNSDGSQFVSKSGYYLKLWNKIDYDRLTLEQTLLMFIWQHAQQDKVSFEIPQELQEDFDQLPDNLKNFLTNKNQ